LFLTVNPQENIKSLVTYIMEDFGKDLRVDDFKSLAAIKLRYEQNLEHENPNGNSLGADQGMGYGGGSGDGGANRKRMFADEEEEAYFNEDDDEDNATPQNGLAPSGLVADYNDDEGSFNYPCYCCGQVSDCRFRHAEGPRKIGFVAGAEAEGAGVGVEQGAGSEGPSKRAKTEAWKDGGEGSGAQQPSAAAGGTA
jgi:hypothetical protein